MRYLVYLPVPEPVTSLLEAEPDDRIHPPPSGYHITIWQINMDERREPEFLQILGNIRRPCCSLEILGTTTLGRDGRCAQALLLSLPLELRRLHGDMLQQLRSFDLRPDLFDRMAKEIGGCWYSPHIAISESGTFPELHNTYAGMRIPVTSFCVNKKIGSGIWTPIATFRLTS